jgi:hypothetical protein
LRTLPAAEDLKAIRGNVSDQCRTHHDRIASITTAKCSDLGQRELASDVPMRSLPLPTNTIARQIVGLHVDT